MSEEVVEEGTVHEVHFTVDGKWLADFARTRFDEGRWDAALNLLVDSLHGLTHDQALAILKGEADLTGDSNSGIDIVELPKDGELAQDRNERVAYMYGDLFRRGDKVWRPYAVVSGWCREDWQFACTFKGNYNMLNVRDDKYHGGLRSLYYANNPNRDMLVRIPERMVGDRVIADVLCEEFTASVPFWVKLPTNIDIPTFVEHVFDKKGVAGIRGLELRGAVFNTISKVESKSPDDELTVSDAIAATEEKVEQLPPAASQDTEVEQKFVENEGRAQIENVILLATQFFEGEEPVDYKLVRQAENAFESVINRLSRHIKDKEWDTVEELRNKFETSRERILAKKVAEQADQHGGWFELPLTDNDDKPYGPKKTLRVPLNPFLIWTFRGNFNFAENGIDLKWDYVAGSGFKMINDDPSHTDWMLGAGVPLKETYDHEGGFGDIVRKSAYRYKDVLVKKYTNRQFTVLARDTDSKWVSGTVCHPKPGERVAPGSIAVVPNAGPDYQFAMETANMHGVENGGRGCIICETGGKLAHLAVVGREYKCIVLMIPDALKLYKEGQRVWIDMESGTIEHKVW